MNKDIEKALRLKKIDIDLTHLDRLLLKSVVNNTIVPEIGKYILDSINTKTLEDFL